MLTACGNQFNDWSAAYRIFKGERMDVNKLFGVIRKEVVIQNSKQQDYIYAHIDVAHRLGTVKHADQIVVLNKGVIAERGTHLELVSLKGEYNQLVKNQLELGS